MSPRTVAFIPVRGGSKSIVGKNIRPIAGRPLVHWVLDAAVSCAAVARIYVATDDDAIRDVVVAFGSDRVEVVGRSPETATDSASTESAMLEFAQTRSDFDKLILIQATSPLLTAGDLDRGLCLVEETGADSLVSVVEQKRFIWRRSQDGLALPQNYDPLRRPRRQEFEGYWVENGAFYVSSRDGLLATGCRLHGRTVACPMPEETYLELDEPADWVAIEEVLRRRAGCAGNTPPFSGKRDGRDTGELQGLIDRGPGIERRPVRLLLTDVDGVLTDCGMYYGEQGDELKKFNTRDGKGFELLRQLGVRGGILTSEDTRIVARRAAKLKLDFLFQGVNDKLAVVKDLLAREDLHPGEVAYIGDDINDLDVLGYIGWAACPADAEPAVRNVARIHCSRRGGEGAVREFAEYLLSALRRA